MRYLIFSLLFLSSLAHAEIVQICFVPSTTSCTDVVVKQIAAAKSTVLVQAYGFTSKPIEQALVDAFKRGVKGEIILDKSNLEQKWSGLAVMKAAGVLASIDSTHAISHNKVLVIDDATVITGSFNLTTSAQKHNAENLIVIRDADVAAAYTANWQAHRKHAVVQP